MKQNVHEVQNTETKNVRKKSTVLLYQALIALIPLLYLYSVWNELPEQVPLHYNANMEADRMGSKTAFLYLIIFMFLISVACSAVILFLNKIDPKKRRSEKTETKVSWILSVFMVFVSSLVIYTTVNYVKGNDTGFFVKGIESLLAVFFILIGNFMGNIRPNHFLGVRTPWTLEDEDNWKETHRLTSKIWFFGGLIMLVFVLILPKNMATHIVWFVIPLAVIPVGYSYYLFRQKQKNVQ
ncbi:MAG: SdpI family protein [Bacteroidetes bacterium]|nr:SdpI family protein [Bacteroidota bacterium]